MPALAVGRHPTLAGAANQRIQTMGTDRLSVAIQEHDLGALAKERSLQLLSESRSWNTSNDVIEKLITPLFDTLTREDLERIIRMPRETGADLPGSTMYGRLIRQVDRLGVIPVDELDPLVTEYNGQFFVENLQQARERAA
jgi:hypothetical protein